MSRLEIGEELGRAQFGDRRLGERLRVMAGALAANPSASLPEAMRTEAGREAAYRFLGNHRVTLEGVLEPHVRATVERAREAGKVYAISDTTEFKFSTDREGLGLLSSESQRGFLGHFCLAVSAEGERRPLGVVGIETLVRAKKKAKRDHFARKKDDGRESLRWQRGVENAAQTLDGIEVVHVMDREADIYELLAKLVSQGHRFIIRSSQNRSVDEGRLFETLEQLPVQFTREISVSPRAGARQPGTRRSHPPRTGRLAQLAVAAKQVTLHMATSTVDLSLPESLAVNAVRVWEPNPPAGEEPVEWRLFTTEPIETQEQIESIIDGYRTRWVIEEYFKALKTGCGFERVQLESLRTLLNLLGIQAAVAWQLLLLRSTARERGARPATYVLSSRQIEVLRMIAVGKPLPPEPTVLDAMTAIAQLGGHIKSNGQPGWQVLGRGFRDLLRAEDLYSRMNSTSSCDQS